MHVGELAVRQLVDEPAIRLHPRARAQRLFARHRHDRHLARAFERRLGVHGEHRLAVRGSVEEPVDVVGRAQLDAVDRHDEVSDRNVHAWRREWRAQVGVPAFGVVDPRDLVAAAVDREVSAKEPPGRLRYVGHVATAHVGVTDGDLGPHVVEQVVQVGAVLHVGQQRAVHGLHLRPVRAVHVLHVEVVALQAPAFVEDLLELGFRLEVHAERRGEAALACLRNIAIGVHEEQPRSTARCGCSAAPAAATPTPAGAIQQLAAVSADVVLGHALHERSGPTIRQAVPMQRAAAATAATTTAATGRRLEIKHRAGCTSLQVRVATFGHTRHRQDALRQSLEIDLHRHRTARTRRRRLLACRRLASRAFPCSTTTPATAASSRRCGADTWVLVAFGQQRARLPFFQHREVKTEVLLTSVRRHVEPLRTQAEVSRSEEPEVLAARIPHGIHRIRESVGHLLLLTGLDVGDENRAVERVQTAREGDPLRVWTPGRMQRALRHHPRIVANHLRLSAGNVEHPDVQVGVVVEDLLGVRGPGGRVVVRWLGQRDFARWLQAVLLLDHELVLPRLVAEVRDVFAVR